MEKKTLTAKEVRERLKRHWTSDMFCEFYGFDSVDKLNEHLNQFFPNRSGEVIRQLKQNDKAFSRKSRKAEAAKTSSIIATPKVVVVTTADVECQENNSPNDFSDIEELRQKVKAFEDSISLESSTLEAMRKEEGLLLTNLRSKYEGFLEIKMLLEESQKKYEEELAKYENVEKSIRASKQNIEALKTQLTSSREELRLLENVVIYVFSDGSIATDNFSGELPKATNLTDLLFEKLSESDFFQDLTVKELKQLGSLKALVDLLKQMSRTFTISFENPNMKEAWESLN